MARWVAEGEGGRSKQPCRRLFQRADDAPESSARAAASAPPSLPPAASARRQPTVCPRRARPTTLPDCVSHARCQRARIATHHARCCVGHPRPTALHRASRRLDRPALSHAETRMALARRASCEKPGSVTVGSLLPYILQPPAGSLLFPCLLQIHLQVHPLPFSFSTRPVTCGRLSLPVLFPFLLRVSLSQRPPLPRLRLTGVLTLEWARRNSPPSASCPSQYQQLPPSPSP